MKLLKCTALLMMVLNTQVRSNLYYLFSFKKFIHKKNEVILIEELIER